MELELQAEIQETNSMYEIAKQPLHLSGTGFHVLFLYWMTHSVQHG